MKVKDIAESYGVERGAFEKFLKDKQLKCEHGFTGITVDDRDVQRYVDMFRENIEILNQECMNKAAEEQRKAEAISKILISSGFNFEGYEIVKYSGYISGNDATQIPRSCVFSGPNGKNLTDAMQRIRYQALAELKEAAYNLGCNAIIGVDFDYITIQPETAALTGGTPLYEPYVICVTANGNAVIIEKKKSVVNESPIAI